MASCEKIMPDWNACGKEAISVLLAGPIMAARPRPTDPPIVHCIVIFGIRICK
jgi:hypothetical protein